MLIRVALGRCFRLFADLLIDKNEYKKKVLRNVNRKKEIKVNKNARGDKIYFVIRLHVEKCGLGTIMVSALANIRYALEKGYIPIIDLQSIVNPYIDKNEVGKVNAWEFFFNQPMGVSLNEIRKSKNVIYTDDNLPDVYPSDNMEFFTNPYAVSFWRKLFKEYIVLNEETQNYIDDQILKKFNNRRILGCVYRGTDYNADTAPNHPMQPDIDLFIDEVKKVFKNGEYDVIFIATEDQNVLEKFKSVFEAKLIYTDQQRYTGKEILARRKEFATESDKRHEGLQYLTAMYLLGKCNAIIVGRCGLTTVSYIISEGYEFEKIWNVGRFGIDEYCRTE